MSVARTRFLSRDRLLTAGVLALAIVIRVWDIRSRSLWFDEAGEFWVATAGIGHLAQAVQTGSGDPPLYSLLLHLWMTVSRGVMWMRLLSLVFSVAGVLGVMTFVRRAAGVATAIAAGILMALLPSDVRYAQEVGQYALMVGALAWNLVALDRFATSPDRRTTARWALTALVASYAYYGAVIAVAAPFACVVAYHLIRRERARLRMDGLAAAFYAVGAVPLAVFMRAQLARVVAHDVSSAGPAGLFAGGAGAAWTWLRQVLAFQLTGWPYTHVPAAIPVVCALVLLGLASWRRQRVVVWLAAAWLVTTLTDAIDVFPYGFRWGLVLTPMLVAAIACGVGAARPRAPRLVALAALALIIAGAVVSLPNRTLRERLYPHTNWPWPETEDLGPVTRYWLAHRTPDQPTYVYYGAALAFAYYTRGAGIADGFSPTWFLQCWHGSGDYCSSDGVYFGRWLRSLSNEQKTADVVRALHGHPAQLWLVFSHIQDRDDADMLAGVMLKGYRIERAFQGAGASAFLLSAR